MKRYGKIIFLLFTASFISFQSIAQESSCTNGIDDDGDGFIDCYDADCADGDDCTDFYVGNEVFCRDEPTENPTFSIRLQWGSPDQSANSHATPVVGDIDSDGTPEVIVTNRQARRLSILDGVTGAYDPDIANSNITLPWEPENTPAIADFDGDGCANILVTQENNRKIAMYDCQGNQLWERTARDKTGMISIADFNEDGVSEIYIRDEIWDVDGNVIVSGSGNWEREYVHGPVAVDILPDGFCGDCSGLELITGNEIWAVNIGSGTKTLAKDLDDLFIADGLSDRYHPKTNNNQSFNWSAISVADFDQDGDMDVIMPGAFGSSSTDRTTIFFWDPNEDQYMIYQPDNNHDKGTGRINIGDANGDGRLNAIFVSDQILFCLNDDFTELWRKGIKEGSSGFTGCTLFDFDGDGAAETVYRSEESLLIIDGTDGSTRQDIPCISRTQEEYPIVADVDNDGSSEICVTCYTSNSTPFNPYSNTIYAQVRIYEADGGEIWQPSRTVWNQHGYFNVNINDNLTVPVVLQDHTIIFGADCEGGVGDNRPLNSFLNQSTFLESDGCPSYVSPDINLLSVQSASTSACPLTEFEVEFNVRNDGDTDINGLLPITFYNGDPTQAGSERLNTEIININGFEIGEELTLTSTVEGPGGEFDLFIVINDNGSQDPPITVGTASIPECETSNNIAQVTADYIPFPLTTEKISDNEKCDPDKPDNGHVRAFYFGEFGGEYETIWLEDFGDLSLGTTSDAGATGWNFTGGKSGARFLGVGQYSGGNAFVGNNTGGKNGNNEVTWTSDVIDITGYTDVALSVDMIASNAQETSGQWRDYLNVYYRLDGGSRILMNNGEGQGSFGFRQASVAGLTGNTVQFEIELHNTGNNEYMEFDNVRVFGFQPPVEREYTEADGFQFFWYEGTDFSTPVHTGSEYADMAEGTYSVVGFSANTNCYSDTLTVDIDLVEPEFNIMITEVSPLTNCTTPNGELLAEVIELDDEGDPVDTVTAGYTFTWFIASEGVTPIGTGATLANRDADTYLVVVENNITGCVESNTGDVTTALILPPAPNASEVDIVACNDLSSGEVSADVGGSTSGYTFLWYEGPSVKPTEDYTGATVTGLTAGDYTVVAVDDATNCESPSTTVTIDNPTDFPTPVASATSTNSSCGAFNGSAVADGDGQGTVTGYDFTWYAGDNTNPNNRLPGATGFETVNISADGSTATGMPSGIYRVVVEDIATGCTSFDTVEVRDDFVEPEFINITNPINTGNSINFAGTGSSGGYIEVPQLLGPGNPVDTAITIQYWANLSSVNYANDHRIFSSGATGENQVLLWSDNHDGIALVIKAQGVGGRGRINSSYSATGWVQLTGTWRSSTGELRMYANGVLLGTDVYAQGASLINTGNNMFIGRDNNAGYGKFQGEIDEVRIYNRVLDIDEINEKRCGELNPAAENGLVLYYNFNDVTAPTPGSTVQNLGSEGTSYDGTVGGANGNTSVMVADIECVDADVTDNFSCDPSDPRGAVNLAGNIDPPLTDDSYTFSIYNGFSISGGALATSTDGSFSGLSEGFYTVIAESATTGCVTTPVTVSISDVPDIPSIFTAKTDDDYCGDLGNGTIEVTSSSNVQEPPTYTYEIFAGSSFSNEIDSISNITVNDGSVGHTFTGLPEGSYRIRVTNDDITCTDFVDVVIDDISTDPAWDSSNTFDNTSCATPNGAANVFVSGGNSGYTFTWYENSVDPGNIIPGESTASIDSLDDGSYYVIATNDVTGCTTPERLIQINDDPIFPDITLSEVSPDEFCVNGNGQLSMSVEDPTNPGFPLDETEFTVTWYRGGDTTGEIVGDTEVTLDTLSSGQYTAEVTIDFYGCSNTETISLGSDQTLPSLGSPSIQENTVCDDTNTPFTGQITLSGAGGITLPDANYEFDWYEGNGTGGTQLSETTHILSNVEHGDYTVVIRNLTSGCTSAPVTYAVPFVPARPPVTDVASTDNTICDETVAGDFNGTATVTIASPSNYQFTWYSGGSETPGNELATIVPGSVLTNNDSRATQIPEGIYTVNILDNLNGCDTTVQVTVGENKADVTFTSIANAINPEDVSTCDGGLVYPNGSITVDPAEINGSGTYTYEFYFGSSVDPGNLLSNGVDIFTQKGTTGTAANPVSIVDNTISNLDQGQYTIVAIDQATGCETTGGTVTIGTSEPVITASETIQHLTNCTTPNGSISVVPATAGGEPAGGYSYQWYFGSGTSNTLDADDLADGSALSGETTSNVQGLEAGTYTVEVTNEDTQCSELFEYDVEDNTVIPVIDANALGIFPNENCTGDPTGTIDVDGAFTPSIAGGAVYDIELLDETGASLTPQRLMRTDTGTVFFEVAAGNYRMRATEVNTTCSTASLASFTVGENLTAPDLNLSKDDETFCSSPNGQVTVGDPGIDPVGGFDIFLYNGVGTTNLNQQFGDDVPRSAFPLSTTSDLDDGTYTVRLVNNQTGCDSIAQITIIENLDEPTLLAGDVIIINDTYCTSDNGSIAVTVTDGTNNTGTNPTFILYSGSNPDPANELDRQTPTGDTYTFSNLGAGTYTVTVLNNESGCESNGITRNIQFIQEEFDPILDATLEQTSCDSGQPNGQLTVSSIDDLGGAASTDLSDYTFTFYRGQSTNPADEVVAALDPDPTFSGTNNSIVDGLPAGIYTVVALNNISGCSFASEETIESNILNPDIAVTPTDPDGCPGNGTIAVTASSDAGADGRDGSLGYIFNLYAGDKVEGSPIATDDNNASSFTFNNLEVGDYVVEVEDNFTGCVTVSAVQTLTYVGPNFTVDLGDIDPLTGTAITQPTDCFARSGEIDLTNTITSITNGGDSVTVTWYEGDVDPANEIAEDVNPADGITGYEVGPAIIPTGQIFNYRLIEVPAINYNAVITADNGCVLDTISINIPELDAPDVTTAVRNSTSCPSPNGEFEFVIDRTDILDDVGNYEFTLFSGIETIPADDGSVPGTYNPPIGDGDLIARTPIPDNDSDPAIEAVNAASITGTTDTLNQLTPGFYTFVIVRSQNPADECPVYVETFEILEPAEPSLTVDTQSPNTICGGGTFRYDGSITIDGSHPSGNSFDFQLHLSDDTPINDGQNDIGGDLSFDVTYAASGVFTTTVNGLPAGDYYMVGTVLGGVGCDDTLSFSIAEDLIDISATTNKVDKLNCAAGDVGTFTVTGISEDGIPNGSFATDYSFAWFDSGDNDITAGSTNSKNDFPSIGSYYVIATNDETGCSTRIDFEIEDDSEDPVVIVNGTTDNTTCPGGPNLPTGSITIQIENEAGVVQTPNLGVDYEVRWFLDAGNDGLDDPADEIVRVPDVDGNEITANELVGGSYFIEVTDLSSPNDECETLTSAVVVVDNPAEVSIQTTVNDLDIDHQQNCSPADGRIEILRVLEDGVGDPADIGDYEFSWFVNDAGTDLDGTSVPGVNFPGGPNGPIVENLPADTYYVSARNINTDCQTDELLEFTILDNTQDPQVQLVQTAVDQICIPLTDGTGEITASVVGGTAVTDYEYFWYQGTSLDPDSLLNLGGSRGGPGADITATNYTINADGNIISDLPDGNYYVEVVDLTDPGLNCIGSATITVQQFTPVFSIGARGVDFTVQDNENCNPANGSITLTGVSYTLPGGGSENTQDAGATYTLSDFTFDWYTVPTGGTPEETDVTTFNAASDLSAGTYYVEITGPNQCESPTRKAIIVDDISTTPTIQSAKTFDTYCDNTGNQGDGTLTIEIFEDTGSPAVDPADYTITWYRGNSVNAANEIFPVDPSSLRGSATIAANDTELSGLATGFYTIEITKDAGGATSPNLGCGTTATFEILSDPASLNLTQADLTIVNNTFCSGNGIIRVDSVREGSIIIPLSGASNYSYSWTGPGSFSATTRAITGLSEGTYEVTVTNDVTGCTTGPFAVDIIDDLAFPTLVFNVDQENSNCGPAKNGQVTVTALDPEGRPDGAVNPRFNFSWTSGTSTPGVEINVTSTSSTLSEIDAGEYTVTVTDNLTGCAIDGTVIVGEDLNEPILDAADIRATVLPDTICGTGPGLESGFFSISDGDLTITSGATVTVADFNIRVYSDAALTDEIDNSLGIAGPFEVDELGFGDYFVVAELISSECVSASLRINVPNNEFVPEIQLLDVAGDNSCGGVASTGTATITADGVDETDPDYDFQWYQGTDVTGSPVPVANGGNTATIFNLPAGAYTAEVLRNSTQCTAVETINIPADQIFPIITSAEENNVTACIDNGSIVIQEISYNGTTYVPDSVTNEFSIEWFVDQGSTPATDGDLSTVFSLDSIAAGQYFARVTLDSTGCSSGLVEFNIISNPLLPRIDLDLVEADSTCSQTGSVPNALVVATADGQGADNPNYQFSWRNVDTDQTVAGATDSLMNIYAATYELTVTNLNTGCVSVETIVVPNVPIDPEIDAVVTTDPTTCNPVNGRIEITSVDYGSLSDYTFRFYDGGGNLIVSGADSVLTGLEPGIYSIEAVHNETQCVTGLTEVELSDEFIDYPDIALAFDAFGDPISKNNTSCDPSNPTGRLSVTANGTQDTTQYTFVWDTGLNFHTLDSIPAGTYTVTVTNRTTGCSTTEEFDIEDELLVPLQLSTSSSPNTNCTDPNGQVAVSVINIGDNPEFRGNNYTYYWYTTQVANPGVDPAFATGPEVTGLPGGTYFVYAVDNVVSCFTSELVPVEVIDETLPPSLEVEIVSHLTICYPDQPNGFVRMFDPDSSLGRYSIEWYVGTDTTGISPFATGVSADSLVFGEYSAVVTDQITGCEQLIPFTILDETPFIPAPNLNVINNRTNCLVPNGFARANVDGETSGYIFEWYELDNPTQVVFTGPEVRSLDSTTYLIQATHIPSGCVSPVDTLEIFYNITDPEFEVAVTNSLCLRTEDGSTNQFSGEAFIQFESFSAIDSIVWFDDRGFDLSYDSKLIDAGPGDYTVWFRADNGCDYTAAFSIEAAIKIYNGVSANGDGQNDFFLIDCLDTFVNNNVKIFNREGTRVFEMDNYNNLDRRFEGFSNVGNRSRELPSGTYFFVIDKGDGSELINGFLELVR